MAGNNVTKSIRFSLQSFIKLTQAGGQDHFNTARFQIDRLNNRFQRRDQNFFVSSVYDKNIVAPRGKHID